MADLNELKKDEALVRYVKDMVETGVIRFRWQWEEEFKKKYPNSWEKVVADVEAGFREMMSAYWWEKLLREEREKEAIKKDKERVSSVTDEEVEKFLNAVAEQARKEKEEKEKKGG